MKSESLRASFGSMYSPALKPFTRAAIFVPNSLVSNAVIAPAPEHPSTNPRQVSFDIIAQRGDCADACYDDPRPPVPVTHSCRPAGVTPRTIHPNTPDAPRR